MKKLIGLIFFLPLAFVVITGVETLFHIHTLFLTVPISILVLSAGDVGIRLMNNEKL